MNNPISAHRPRAISTFFIYKAGVFAAGFWAWLAILAVTGGQVSGWHVVAGTGATTTTLVGVVLGVRYAMQRSAAIRHEEIMRTLVELDWYAFAKSAGSAAPGTPGPPPTGTPSTAHQTAIAQQRDGGDADVIQLGQDLRQRPRR